jgi:hypothetical protein
MGNNLHEYLLRYSSALSSAPMMAHSCHKWTKTDERTWEDYLMNILGQRKEEGEWGRHGNK